MNLNIGRTIHINRNGFTTIAILLVISMLLFYVFSYSDNVGKNLNTKKQFNQFINLRDLLSASIDAAERGGRKVYLIRESASLQEKSKGKTEEGANDPVTDGDMQSHIEMYHSINKAFPSITIISEEKSSHQHEEIKVEAADLNVNELQSMFIEGEFVEAKDIQVWIDPLDATQEYTENLRQYVTTMVCVAVRGVPTIGVIHKPFSNFTAWAWVDRAHNPRLKVKEESSTPDSPVKVIVSRSHKGPVVSRAEAAFGKDVQVTPAGGAGYKTLEVLSGVQDVYFHSTLIKKWDICAGHALLTHFKGHLTTVSGAGIDYSSASEYKNPDGLVASLHHHDFYLNKLQKSAEKNR